MLAGQKPKTASAIALAGLLALAPGVWAQGHMGHGDKPKPSAPAHGGQMEHGKPETQVSSPAPIKTTMDAELEKLPLRTPADRIERLPFIVKGGVKEFRVEASEFRWEYQPGKWVHVWGYNGQIPGPEIRVTEGDRVRMIVKNNLPDATTVHWHGVDLGWQADGVPGITQKAIAPGEEFVYEFTAKPAGTRFYHTHGKSHGTAAQQLDMGLSGPLIIEPKHPAYRYDREYTLVLDEWEILPNGINTAIAHAAQHNGGAPGTKVIPDFNIFTFNGRVFPYTQPLKVRKGEKVLIRLINAGTDASHPMHLHGHNYDVVALDGNPVPMRQKRNALTLNPGETAEFLVTADNPGPWLFHCHNVHHSDAGMMTLFQYEGYEPVEKPAPPPAHTPGMKH